MKAALLARRKPLQPAEAAMMRTVMDRIGREGPLMARDFEYDRETKSTGWWDWRPSKLALERLHFEGKLVTIRKKNFEKVYDLPENVVPADIDLTPPSTAEYVAHTIVRSVKALGIASFRDINFRLRYAGKRDVVKAQLQTLVDGGRVVVVEVRGAKNGPYYTLPAYLRKPLRLSNECFILSPFDILNVYRSRLKDFFGFDYMVECFVPEAKRKYGYFALPVLVGDRFIARMDAKADRKSHELIIFNLHFESGGSTPAMISRFADALVDFAGFNQCTTISIQKCNNKSIAQRLAKKVNDSLR